MAVWVNDPNNIHARFLALFIMYLTWFKGPEMAKAADSLMFYHIGVVLVIKKSRTPLAHKAAPGTATGLAAWGESGAANARPYKKPYSTRHTHRKFNQDPGAVYY